MLGVITCLQVAQIRGLLRAKAEHEASQPAHQAVPLQVSKLGAAWPFPGSYVQTPCSQAWPGQPRPNSLQPAYQAVP